MSSTNKFLSLVKSTNLNVTSFVGVTLDPCFTKGFFESSPLIYKNGSSFYFDYSGSVNGSDLKLLKRFFDGITVGGTFGISGGTYFVEDSGSQYNFNGTYSLSGKTGTSNQYLNFSGISYPPSLPDGVYENTNFLNPINFFATVGATAQYFISKVNKKDPININFLGIYGNDYGFEEYLEVPESSLNTGRLKINNAIKLNDGSEIIYLNSANIIISENLYFKPTAVNIYMRGVPETTVLSQSTELNGLIKKMDLNGKTTNVYDNQNLRQRYCRALNDENSIYDWFSFRKSATIENLLNPLAYNGLSLNITYFSFLKLVTSEIVQSVNEFGQFIYREALAIAVDGVKTKFVRYTSDNSDNEISVLKIDLSDSSLYGTIIEPYYDYECSLPLDTLYYLNGVPGFDGASFIYLKQVNSPRKIFLKITQQNSIVLEISF
jgi:hypothetical protein